MRHLRTELSKKMKFRNRHGRNPPGADRSNSRRTTDCEDAGALFGLGNRDGTVTVCAWRRFKDDLPRSTSAGDAAAVSGGCLYISMQEKVLRRSTVNDFGIGRPSAATPDYGFNDVTPWRRATSSPLLVLNVRWSERKRWFLWSKHVESMHRELHFPKTRS